MLNVAPSLLIALINTVQSCLTEPGICGRGSVLVPAGNGNSSLWLSRAFRGFCTLFFLHLSFPGILLLSWCCFPSPAEQRPRVGEPFSLHQQLSIGNPACPGTEADKRSLKKYHRGFFYDSTAAHLYFICLPGVAPCLSLIGLAELGEIFIFFPSDMIRFVEARAEQRRCGAQSLLLPSPAVPPALCQEKVCSGGLLAITLATSRSWNTTSILGNIREEIIWK